MSRENENWDIEGQLNVFDILAEADKPETPLSDPQTFADYIGLCEYCMWYGYGLYDNITRKRKPGTEGLHCQWEEKSKGFLCIGRSKWKPGVYYIPRLCGNCRESNCFHYQKKPQYDKDNAQTFRDPVEEPNIYCTREEGSVNRQYPYEQFYEKHFGATLWDRQHEWDTCDAWVRDTDILQEPTKSDTNRH